MKMKNCFLHVHINNYISHQQYSYWINLGSLDIIIPGSDNSLVVIIHVLGPYPKGVRGVVNEHQHPPASHDEGALPMEGSEYLWVKDTNKSLQMMIYSVSDPGGHPVVNRNTATNMKNTQ